MTDTPSAERIIRAVIPVRSRPCTHENRTAPSGVCEMGFSMDEVLKKAMLPEDLFARQTSSLAEEEYFRFMGAIDVLSTDEQMPSALAAS